MLHLLCPEAPHGLGTRDLHPEQPGFILTIDQFLSPGECAALMAAADSLGLEPARPDDLRPKKNEAFLNRETLAVVDVQLAERLWSRLLPHLPCLEGREPVGLQGDRDATPSQLKFYRYRRGHRFGPHVDTSHKGVSPDEETEFTFLVYLNSAGQISGEPAGTLDRREGDPQALSGGDTVFKRTVKAELARVTPQQGMGLLHAHGRRCCMHEAEEVTHGEKYVLRADVTYRRVGSQVARDVGPDTDTCSSRSRTTKPFAQDKSGRRKGKMKFAE